MAIGSILGTPGYCGVSSVSFIKLTTHAKDQALLRFAIGSDRLLELAEKAVTDGYSIKDAPSEKVARFLRRKAKGKKIYVYDGYIFIMDDEMVLVTTYRMPKWLLLTLKREKTYIGND